MSIELTYDKENRLIQHHDVDAALITDFSYDPFSHKKLETEDGRSRELYWLDDLYLGEGFDGMFDKAYVQADGYLVGEVEDVQGQQNTNYYIVDYLGSVVAENDETGSVWNERRYTPYGGLLSGDDFVPFAPNWVGAYGYRYNGLTYATQYMWHRHWSGESKQWITRDPLWPQQLPYAYVEGGPLTGNDPSGLIRTGQPLPSDDLPTDCVKGKGGFVCDHLQSLACDITCATNYGIGTALCYNRCLQTFSGAAIYVMCCRCNPCEFVEWTATNPNAAVQQCNPSNKPIKLRKWESAKQCWGDHYSYTVGNRFVTVICCYCSDRATGKPKRRCRCKG